MTRIRLFAGIAIVASLAIVALLAPRIASTQQPMTPAVKAYTPVTTYTPIGVSPAGTHGSAYLIAVPTGGNPYPVLCVSGSTGVPECKAGAPLP